jgi:anti-anti-sigma factor
MARCTNPIRGVDASNVDSVRLAFEITRSEPLVIADLRDVSFIDSAGLGALIRAVRNADEHGNAIAVACDRDPLLHLFEMVRFDRIALVAADVESALDALRATEALRDPTSTHADRHAAKARTLQLPA